MEFLSGKKELYLLNIIIMAKIGISTFNDEANYHV
jgi:hypothetical protein